MNVRDIDLNVLDAPVDAIAHCCNCFNTMGSGVAKAIRTKYPEVYEADCQTIKGDKNKLGKFTLVKLIDSDCIQYVFNLYAQYTYGTEKRQVNYEALYLCLEGLRESCKKLKIKSLGFPRNMCCTRAGGNWNIVYMMIQEIFYESGIEIWICNYVKI